MGGDTLILIGIGIWNLYLLYKIWDSQDTTIQSIRKCKRDTELMIKSLDRKLESKDK